MDNDTIPSYRIDNLPELYTEVVLKKIEITLKESRDVMKALNSKLIKMSLTIIAYTY